MGRIVKEIVIGDKRFNALFDTGSERSYITRSAYEEIKSDIICKKTPSPFKSSIGGEKHRIDESCLVDAEIEGLEFDFMAHPIDDEMGIVEGVKVDILIGATTMEMWEIIPIPAGKGLDLEGLRRREFVEYCGS